MKHIAIIGECMIELNGKPFGEMHQTFGGDTLNAAVYLSRGLQANPADKEITVSYVTALGTDPLCKGMLTRWQEEGINTNLVLRDEHRTAGLYLIQLDEHGERTFLYWRNQSAACHLLQHKDFERVVDELKHVDMVFLSGISLAILSKEDRASLLVILAELKEKGVEIAFDSNFRPALWPKDDNKTVKATYEAMYKLTDLALVTFDDEQLIWGDQNPEQTVERLSALGVTKCIAKLGKDGCLVFEANGTKQYVSTTEVKNVVDTTSAGDSFNGGFLSAYLADFSLEKSCERGNKLAGTVIQHRGAIIPKAMTQATLETLKEI